jgi:hypothetical protein
MFVWFSPFEGGNRMLVEIYISAKNVLRPHKQREKYLTLGDIDYVVVWCQEKEI